MSKKVLYCASTFSHIRHFHLPYLRYFKKEGWEVHVAGNGSEGISEADKLFRFPFKKNLFSLSNIKTGLKISNLIKREQYDLVISNSALAGFLTRFFAPSHTQARFIHISHGYFFPAERKGLKDALYILCEKLCAAKTDMLLVMNESDYRAAKKFKLCEKVKKIPGMGIPDTFHASTPEEKELARRQLHIPEDSFVFIYPAEFSKRKNHKYLLAAFSEAVKINPKLLLLLPGNGTLLEKCKRFVSTKGLSDQVIFPGYVSNMALYYAASDCAVSSSISEGLPFNIMEAMACGLPVICTAVRGHVDLIKDGMGGILIPLSNGKRFTNALLEICGEYNLLKKFSSYNYTNIVDYRIKSTYSIITFAYNYYTNII